MKVLIPLDGTSHSEIILSWAPCFLELPDSKVHILHCTPGETSVKTKHVTRGISVTCDKYAEEVARRFEGAGGRIQTHTEEGDPTLNIVRLYGQKKIDLLAMRTRAKSGLSRILMGSTTSAVMETLDGPFFVIGPAVKKPKDAPSIKSILVPLDGSSTSKQIVEDLEPFAKAFKASVTLFQVYPEETSARKQSLEALEKELTARGIPATSFVGIGKPAVEIVNHVFQPGFDLVAMSTHGRSGIQRLLLGSVAEEVIRKCPCPVLLRRST